MATSTQGWGAIVWAALRRFLRSDLQQERALPEERAILAAASPPIVDEVSQDYAAWRRSLLWIACAALAVVGILDIALFTSQEDQILRGQLAGLEASGTAYAAEQARQNTDQIVQSLGRDNLEMLDGIFATLILPVLLGALLCGIAARRWHDLRLSRRRARLAFLISFLTPFCLAVFPVKEMLDLEQMTPAARMAVPALIGIPMGLYYFMLIGPRSIALFPAVIRSSITIKTMLPESPMPGWAMALAAPLYAVFLMVIFTTTNQMYGNYLLLAGIGCLMLAPLFYVRKPRALLRPLAADEVSRVVGSVRRPASIANLLGFVFLGAFLLEVDVMSVGDAVKFSSCRSSATWSS